MKADFIIETVKRADLVTRAKEHSRLHGESVWARTAYIGRKRIALSTMWTSLLMREFTRISLEEQEPDERIGGFTDSEWRLYLREGEYYSLEGVPKLRKQYPLAVKIKSEDEYLSLRVLPRSSWWEAPFVCPFCSRLCIPGNACAHSVVRSGHLAERMKETLFGRLFKEMSDREFCCNLPSLCIPGLVIKQNIDSYGIEWFRLGYVYVESPKLVAEIEQHLQEAKSRQQ